MSGPLFVDATFEMAQVIGDISCGATTSIDVDHTNVEALSILRLIAPTVIFRPGFTVEQGGELRVKSHDSCSTCGPE